MIKMWTFVNLKNIDKKFIKPIHYGWVLKIDDFLQLQEYLDTFYAAMIREAYVDCKESKEYQYAIGNKNASNYSHSRNVLGSILPMLASRREESIVSTLSRLSTSVTMGMQHALEEFGAIYIQSSGSYMMPHKSTVEIKTIRSKKLVFPGKDKPRFLRWPGGRHWYAKIGNTDIKIDGKMKWNTKEEAQSAATIFLKE